MPVSVHIEGESADAVRAEMTAFLGGYDKAPAPTGEATATVAIAGTNVVTDSKPPRGGRRGAAKTETAPAEVQQSSQQAPAVVTSATVAEGTAEPEKKLLTLDDVRAAAAPYIKKFTIAAAQEDLQYALDAAVGKRTMSALDDKNQDELAKAVAAFDAAAAAEARFPKPADWK